MHKDRMRWNNLRLRRLGKRTAVGCSVAFCSAAWSAAALVCSMLDEMEKPLGPCCKCKFFSYQPLYFMLHVSLICIDSGAGGAQEPSRGGEEEGRRSKPRATGRNLEEKVRVSYFRSV